MFSLRVVRDLVPLGLGLSWSKGCSGARCVWRNHTMWAVCSNQPCNWTCLFSSKERSSSKLLTRGTSCLFLQFAWGNCVQAEEKQIELWIIYLCGYFGTLILLSIVCSIEIFIWGQSMVCTLTPLHSECVRLADFKCKSADNTALLCRVLPKRQASLHLQATLFCFHKYCFCLPRLFPLELVW